MINGKITIAMLNYQRVFPCQLKRNGVVFFLLEGLFRDMRVNDRTKPVTCKKYPLPYNGFLWEFGMFLEVWIH